MDGPAKSYGWMGLDGRLAPRYPVHASVTASRRVCTMRKTGSHYNTYVNLTPSTASLRRAPSAPHHYGIPLVPFLLQGVAGVDRLNQRDGIHPTAEGARKVADNVWTVLFPLLGQARSR